MKKGRNDKDIKENVMSNSLDDELMNVDNIDVDNLDIDTMEKDGDEEESLLKESSLKEWDFTDDEEIQEFLSHDFDVVAESRRRIQNNQNRVKRGRQERESREKAPRATKEKATKEKVDKEKTVKEKAHSDVTSKENSLKSLWTKWLDIYHGNTMQILFGALMCLVVLLVVAIIATYPSEVKTVDAGEKETTTKQEETTTEDVTEPTTEEPTITPEAEGSDIHSLIVGYIDAAYIKADMEAVALVVDDTTNINVDKYKSRQKYIEQYENIKCYKVESAIENAYIIFVTYDAKLFNIETLAPSAETFVVKYDAANSKYLIHNLTVAEELDSYIAGASKIAYISEIRAEVESRLNVALNSDADLKKVYDLMMSTGSQASEEVTSETTPTDETTTVAPQ